MDQIDLTTLVCPLCKRRVERDESLPILLAVTATNTLLLTYHRNCVQDSTTVELRHSVREARYESLLRDIGTYYPIHEC
jgi:hypothetical protein